MTTFTTGTNNLEGVITAPPLVVITGTPITYVASQVGMTIIRSNATVAMVDTLPALNNQVAANGWTLNIYNTDASAAITLTAPTGYLIDGASTKSLAAGTRTRVIWDGGVNFYA